MDIYIVETETDKITKEYNGYSLYKLSYSNYKNNPTNKIEVDYLDDVSKHILLLFSSATPNTTHQKVYEQFHDVLDNISLQYKTLTGKLPRFNLIGHSRGGIINLMYATEHIYNVDSIYSLGTPYNGSTLGLIDSVMVMMNYYYTDIEGVTYLNPIYMGVGDIMDEDINKNLRNSWNEVVSSSDVDINAVAYGSMTSIGFIKALINDILENRKNSDKYYSIITEYQDLLNTITNVADDCPNLTSTILTIVNGLAKIAAKFSINLYDTILGSIDSNLVGTVTVEEAEKVLSLYNVINDEAVIMDDLFIDTNSQLGYGFSDGINFNEFERYVKIFNANDLSTNCAIPSSPAIPHNLEIMCDEYINDILNSIVLGIPCGEGALGHDYSYNYTWINLRSHSVKCHCGARTTQPHVVSNNSFSSGSSYATCLLCGGSAEIGFTQLNINSSIINKVTNNGSFILPNGVIVLQDEDIEAYLNGTLKFYNKNEVIE